MARLPGGVSSDIWRAELPSRVICVKRALPRLKVAAEWRAPVARSRYEVEWMRVAGAIAPGAVPEILGEDRESGAFAMAYLDPADHPSWKALLAEGAIDETVAAAVGDILGRIHAATADRPEIAARFPTDDIFHAIRLEPYLVATSRTNPDLAPRLLALVEATRTTKRALVHGDFSPKNILVGPRGPVILDAECAWYGDPAFDVAFVLNHLLLKGAWRPQWRARYAAAQDALVSAYFAHVRWEDASGLAARTAALLPALMLARVDGKSPVEYLADDAQKARVRAFARPLVAAPVDDLREIASRWVNAEPVPGCNPVPVVPVVATIARVHARRVWDSRGRPTVEAEVTLAGGTVGRAIAPAGASRGTREAVDLRDGGTALGGRDVTRAIENVEGPIAKALAGLDAADQAAVDAALIAQDGTPDKSRLGGNATVAVSLAVARAAAAARGLPLWRHLAGEGPVSIPLPEIQIFGGGAHADRRIDVQDLMVLPVGAKSFSEALLVVADVHRAAGEFLREAGRLAGVADEGGWWPAFETNEEALAALVRAIERAGYAPGADVAISLDVAASEFGRDGRYALGLERRELDRDAMIGMLLRWLDRYPIASIEDPLAEDDRDGWIAFARAAGHRVQIVGDDYLTTSAARVGQAAADRACNAVLVKPNQAGTVTEALAALRAGKNAGFATIVSARSGETEDVSIVHLAVGWDAGQLKVGSFARGERTAKWNEALRIEEALGGSARYAGRAALAALR